MADRQARLTRRIGAGPFGQFGLLRGGDLADSRYL
nr:MAG TPA: hypothetical protein [Bacteriophage sp.]